VPTGTESRNPVNRSAVATQILKSPRRRYSWALSLVASRNAVRAGTPIASNLSSPAAAANSEEREPSTKRPEKSLLTNRWCSRATANRCAVVARILRRRVSLRLYLIRQLRYSSCPHSDNAISSSEKQI